MIKQKFKTEYLKYGLTGCFVDTNKRFALIHIFKNASISIRNALNMRGNYEEWENIKKNDSIKTLCVIRDPINRFISGYQYILRLEDGGGFPDRHPVEKTKKTLFYINREEKIKSFLMFLDFIENNGFYDATIVPQYQFLKCRNLNIEEINHVFVLENICEEFDLFCKKYKIDNNLKIDNSSSKSTTKELLNFVNANENIKNRIRDMYSEDFFLYKKILEGK